MKVSWKVTILGGPVYSTILREEKSGLENDFLFIFLLIENKQESAHLNHKGDINWLCLQ